MINKYKIIFDELEKNKSEIVISDEDIKELEEIEELRNIVSEVNQTQQTCSTTT